MLSRAALRQAHPLLVTKLLASQILLQSSDGQEFQVEENVAFQSVTVRNMIEDTGSDFAVPLPNVNGITLSKVLEYCNRHR